MNRNDLNEPTNRRGFLGSLATGAAVVGITSIAPTLNAFGNEQPAPFTTVDDPEKILPANTGSCLIRRIPMRYFPLHGQECFYSLMKQPAPKVQIVVW